MEVGILGSLQISVDDTPEHIVLAPKPKSLLATLLVNAGKMVPVSTLVHEVWGEDPPASALRNIQTYVLQVRKLLSQMTGLPLRSVANELLVTRAGGYFFSDTSATFDYRCYRKLAGEGRDLLREGSDETGMDRLASALGLWRGPVFADVVAGEVLDAQRRQFEESRLGVIENLSDVKNRMGRHQEVIVDLATLTSEHIFHEGLHYQYMRALDMAGLRVRALEVFNKLRLTLVSELGIEPGAPLQQLQGHILNGSDSRYNAL